MRDWAVPFECLRVKELRVTEESGEEGEDAGELGGAQVVEDGVAAVEEDADAA